MADINSLDLTARFFGVIGTNILLSGDNAVVIAMASRGLPSHLRRRAILWGASGAVVLRIIFAAIVTLLLAIPYLQVVGGVLLLWISWQLVNSGADSHDVEAGGTVWGAVQVIIVADAVMSLDNVIALVGISGGNLWLLGIGVVLTIPLVIWGSTLLSNLLNRFPILVYAGSALLVWVAVEMISSDEAVAGLVSGLGSSLEMIIKLAVTGVFVFAILAYSRIRKGSKS